MDDPIIQQLKSAQNWAVFIIPAVFIVIGAVVTVVVSNRYQKQIDKRQSSIDAQEKAIKANEGELTKKKMSSLGDKVVILLGTLGVEATRDQLLKGIPIIPLKNLNENRVPEYLTGTIKIVNDTLLVSAVFRSADDKIVAEIVDNQWKVNINNYWKRNYDESGFEVIDQTGLQRLQIDMISDSLMEVSGMLKNKEGYFMISRIITGSSVSTHKDPEKQRRYYRKRSEEFPDMFKYPSEKYLGIRMKPKIKGLYRLSPDSDNKNTIPIVRFE